MTVEQTQLINLVKDWVRERDRRPGDEAGRLTEEMDLIASSTLDSVGFIELLAFVEEKTGRPIDLNDVDPTHFTTVAGLCQVAVEGA